MEKSYPTSTGENSTIQSIAKHMYEKTITIAKGNSSLGRVSKVSVCLINISLLITVPCLYSSIV